jgi:hypothetical protein
MFQLRPLSEDAIPASLAKAERYRLLNEPGQAESICFDVLAIDPNNQLALTSLILALTDQFQADHTADHVARAEAVLPRLHDEYARAYYGALIKERRARAYRAAGRGRLAYDWVLDALHGFDRAIALRAAGNDDAILRWNACVRMLEALPQPSHDADQAEAIISE